MYVSFSFNASSFSLPEYTRSVSLSWNCVLLEENRTEARIEGTDAFLLKDLSKSADETVGETWG